MRAFVFTDESLASRAGQFVWLDLDTEEAVNAPALERYPIDALPTLLVVDPRTETVLVRWVGSLTVPQLHTFLDQGRAAFLSAGKTTLARADRAYGERKWPEAAKLYAQVLVEELPGFPAYGRVLESLLYAYGQTEAYGDAVELARRALPRLKGTPSALSVAAAGLDAALSLPEGEEATAAADLFERELRAALADATLEVATDDRSGAYQVLLAARKKRGDAEGAKAAARDWARLLEEAATRAKTPEERTVFDSHRLGALLELQEAEKAIPFLQASERDFPTDYNPPARLAAAYQALKRWDDALAASERALKLVDGPRRLRVLEVKAEVQAAKGDAAAAGRTLDEAIAYAEKLPVPQRSEKRIAGLQKKRDKLAPPPAREAAPAKKS